MVISSSKLGFDYIKHIVFAPLRLLHIPSTISYPLPNPHPLHLLLLIPMASVPDSPQRPVLRLLEALLCPNKVEESSGNVFPLPLCLLPPSPQTLANV